MEEGRGKGSSEVARSKQAEQSRAESRFRRGLRGAVFSSDNKCKVH